MAIALGTYKSSYYIKPSQVTLMANDQNNPSLVYVGVRSGTYVEIYYADSTGATPFQVIGYGPNSSYQKWQLSGSSTKLASNAKHYIYIRLRRTEKTAMLIFSTRLYDFYGKNVDGVNHAANRDLYYYILAGELTATDGTSQRELTFQTGILSTPENSYDKEEADSKFLSFEIADQRYLNQVEDDTAKGVITFLQGIKIGSWEGENTSHSFQLLYDETLDSVVLSRTDGKPAHFLATGALSTRGLGEIEEGGGGTGTGVDLLNVPSDIIPIVGGTYSLGASGKAWKTIYANNGAIGSLGLYEGGVISNGYIKSINNSWLINPDGSASLGSITSNGEPVATRNWVNSQSFAKTSDLTSINNNISSLQASTFTGANAPEGKGYTLTWFTQSGGGRNVTIPAYGKITDGLAGIGQNVALVDQWLISDLIAYINDVVTGGSVDLTSVASDIIPDGNLTRKLGSSSNRWSLLYVNSINAGTIAPRTDNGWDLGMTTFRWRNLYAVDGHLDSLTIGGETAATQSYVTSQLGSYATTSALSNYVTLNSAQTISGKKTFTGGITASHLYSVEYLDSSELTINAEKVNFIYDGDDADVQIGLLNGYKPLTLGNTSFSPALTSGTVIGTITIGGESKTIYAPSGGSADLSNYVTLDSEQTITGSKYFSDLNANSIYLQGFELKPYNPNGYIPDRLMYDGYVLLDEFNYSEYLDSSYVKKSGDTVTGKLGFTGSTFPHIYGNGNYLILAGASNETVKSVIIEKYGFRPYTNNNMPLGISGNRWSNVYSVLGNFSGQITSTVADGTAPFVVSSTTEVSNLNAEYVKGYTVNRAGFVTNTDGTTTMIPTLDKQCNVFFSASGLSSYWTKFATITALGNTNTVIVTLLVGNEHQGDRYQGRGILEFKIRNDSSTPRIYFSAVSGDIDCSSFRCYYPTTISSGTEIELWVNVKRSWNSAVIRVLNETSAYAPINVVKMFTGARSSVETPTLEDYVEPERVSLATKLSTARTLWGQSFDGSGNVSGALSEVTTITGVGGTPLQLISSGNGVIYLKINNDNASAIVLNTSQFKPFVGANLKFDLGAPDARWKGIYGNTLDLSGTLGVTGVATFGNDILYNSGDAVLKIYDIDIDSENYGNEAVALQTCFDKQDPETSDCITRYEQRCNLLLQPRGGQVYVGYTPTSVQDVYALNVSQKLRLYGDANSSNIPEISFYRDGVSSWKIMNSGGNLIFQNNYTTVVQGSYFDVLKLNYNSGNAVLKGSLYGGSAIYSNGKTGMADGKAGFYAGSGYIGITGATPVINFHYGNSTSSTSVIKEVTSGTLGLGTSVYNIDAYAFGKKLNIYGDALSTDDPLQTALNISTAYGDFTNVGIGIRIGQVSNEARAAKIYYIAESTWANHGGIAFYNNEDPTTCSEKLRLTNNGNLIPKYNTSTQSLGSSDARWVAYLNSVDVSGDATIGGETVATQVWVNSQSFAKTSDLTSINNSISSLQASTFEGANNPEGYTLTWFTQSGGGRNVTIPAYGEITDGLAGIGQNVALVDQWLIADLISYVDDAVTGGSIDLTSVASDIIPDGNLTRKLGSSSNRWSLLYVNSINAGTIAPRTDNGWDLGMTTFRWRNLYAVDGHLDSLTIGGETAATQSYVTSQLGSYATTSALSNYVTLNSAQTISGKKTFTGGITASHLYSVDYLDSSELTINAEKVNFIYDGDDADVQIGLINGYKPLTLGNTSFTSTYTGGIAIGTIKIGDVVKTIYAPSGGSDLSYITQDVTISVNPEDVDQASFRLYFGDGGNIFGMYTDDVRELNLDADVVYAAMVGVLHTELLRCYEVIQMSDIRYKDIKESVHLELSDIAAAPTFRFNWKDKDNKKNYVGSSAQYWQSLVEEFVVEDKKTGKLGLDYSTAALVSAISIAREVNTMKMWQTSTTDRIDELEERVKALEEENKALRELLNNN